MIVESLAIIVIVAIIIFTFIRRGRKNAALGTLPLLLVPIGNILGDTLNRSLSSWQRYIMMASVTHSYDSIVLSIQPVGVHIFIITISLLIAGAIYEAASRTIHAKAIRRLYLAICGGFSTILAILFISNLIF